MLAQCEADEKEHRQLGDEHRREDLNPDRIMQPPCVGEHLRDNPQAGHRQDAGQRQRLGQRQAETEFEGDFGRDGEGEQQRGAD